MADVQDGARGAPGTEDWVKLQLEKVALALNKDMGYAQIHECAMAHICTDPNTPRGRRAELGHLHRRGGVLQNLRPWTVAVGRSNLELNIGMEKQGKHAYFWDPSGVTSKAQARFYSLVSDAAKGASHWKTFRESCLDNMQLQPLDNYEAVVKALGQNSDVIDKCPLPLPDEADEKRERLKLAMFLAGVAPPPASLGLNHRWQPAAVAVRQAWKLPLEPAAPDAAGGDVITRPGQANAEDPGTFPNVATTHGQRTTAPTPAPSFDADKAAQNRRLW